MEFKYPHCAACGDQLKAVEAVTPGSTVPGERIWHHQSGVPNHAADPVWVAKAPVCDFCCNAPATQVYLTKPEAQTGRVTDNFLDEPWGSCETCTSFIEAETLPKLVRRSCDAFKEVHALPVLPAEARAEIYRRHQRFVRNRVTGPMTLELDS
ncbi:hypothetical protein [Streptomyces sp. H27-C3]|uniref:hypothetical protein n=1 Tax=Streptomyces sp. H27-C3 TaxID=3046305 RepID=UPI0024BB7A7F|nr:hypothetical protein [Streptomyces sp. H27-C3]MDJ0463195.1 hypothetical protein [Streptomyces sp. H27-C3]